MTHMSQTEAGRIIRLGRCLRPHTYYSTQAMGRLPPVLHGCQHGLPLDTHLGVVMGQGNHHDLVCLLAEPQQALRGACRHTANQHCKCRTRWLRMLKPAG